MKNGKKLALCGLVLAAIISSAALASLLITYMINTQIVIKPKVSMGVFDVDGTTPLTYIDFGQFEWNEYKRFPGGVPSPEVPTQFWYIKNTDQVSFYVAFEFQDFPAECSVYLKRGDQTDFTVRSPGSIYDLPIESPIVNADPETQYALFYFSIGVSGQPEFGTYTPKILIRAYDTPTG